LIEVLAVVLILGLVMSLLLPAVGAGGSRSLRKQGDRVAATLELARQRAIMTGKPHRVVLDLEAGSFGIDWLVSERQAYPLEGEDAEEEDPEQGLAAASTLPDGTPDLAPPLDDTRDYYPIPNQFGRMEALDRGYFFEGVDTPEGWIETGQAYLVFEWDGESDAAQIVISDPDNRSIQLAVAPLIETVRIREETD
jgi:type II secretory pathway pseudopilin PulG